MSITDSVNSIPLCGAIIALIFLHRRLQRRQRAEDLNDPHDSIDFGMQGVQKNVSKRPGKNPEMVITDLGGATHSGKKGGHGHGLSFDLGVNSPYLLPAGLQGSNESIHSMSRNFHDEHDPYRPVTMMRPSMDTDSQSLRFGRLHDDKGSLYSMSTGHHSSSAALIANARPMSQTTGKFGSESVSSPLASTPASEFPPRSMHSSLNRTSPPYTEKSLSEIVEKEVLPSPPAVPEPVAFPEMPPPRKSSASPTHPIRKDSMSTPTSVSRPESSNYGDDEPAAPTNPNVVINEPYEIDPLEMYARYSIDGADAQPAPAIHAPQPQRMSTVVAPGLSIITGPPASGSRLSVMGGGQRLSVMGAGNRLSVMGARPLPADLPDDNPEVRANRIRSFYKEYFDDSKPVPANAQYEEDAYYDDGFMDGAIYDPDTGGFFVPGAKPFAQPVGRRAMTPPPRSKPRVSGNSSIPHQRKYSTYSTMSGGRPGARGRPIAQKKLPPPLPLLSLPTPHALKQDAWIFNPIDFAPPTSLRGIQNGARPDSPFGEQRPYSPSVKAFTPLASSFDVLAVLPSPHDLRKSTTFTALDFAPPSRIRDPAAGGGSDAGSIRSARSGISAMQHQAVREGAYRVSRIPKEMVTSREDLTSQLRPKMDMVSRA